MPYKTKGWSKESRQKAAKNCRKNKPWKYATGPKTKAGKAAIKHNATKHGFDSAPMRELRNALYAQRRFLKELEKILSIKL